MMQKEIIRSVGNHIQFIGVSYTPSIRICRISKDGRKSDTDILHDTESVISEPKEEFQRNNEPEKVKFITKVFQYQILKDADFIL